GSADRLRSRTGCASVGAGRGARGARPGGDPMFCTRAAVAAGLASAVLAAAAGAASADPPPDGSSPPNCENGQSHAWANDPQGDLSRGGKLESCFIGEPPASEPLGTPPRCENGQSHAWANDPQGDLSHGGKLESCFIGEPPGN